MRHIFIHKNNKLIKHKNKLCMYEILNETYEIETTVSTSTFLDLLYVDVLTVRAYLKKKSIIPLERITLRQHIDKKSDDGR